MNLIFLTILLISSFSPEVSYGLKLPKNPSNFDAITDAVSILEDLRAIVLGNIQAAQNKFDAFYSDITTYSNSAVLSGGLAIDQVHSDVSAELITIKELAQQANKDISRCTGGREQMINKLPTELKGRIDTCIVAQNEEAAKILDSSNYIVDVTMSKVSNFEFQLKICGESSACVEPIITQMQNNMVSLPEDINVQVTIAEELILELKTLVWECRDNNVADFTGYVTDLIQQIATCANGILGRP